MSGFRHGIDHDPATWPRHHRDRLEWHEAVADFWHALANTWFLHPLKPMFDQLERNAYARAADVHDELRPLIAETVQQAIEDIQAERKKR